MADLVRYHGGGSSFLDRLKKLTGGGAMRRGHDAGMALRQISESAAVGAAVGVVAAKHGNELQVGSVTVPIDLAVAALGIAGSMLVGTEVSSDLRNMGSAGITLYAHRMAQKLTSASPATIAGERYNGARIGVEDPIIAAARLL